MRYAEELLRDLDGVCGEIADVGRAVIGSRDQGVERQVRTDGFDTMGGKGRSRREGGSLDPADDPVATRAAPKAVASAVEDVEGLAEDELVNRMIAGLSVGMQVRDGNRAMHRPDRPEGGGADNAFQRLLGQIGPGERGARVQNGGDFSQAWARPVEPLS